MDDGFGDEKVEWNLNSWWLTMLGENWRDSMLALKSKEIDIILDCFDMWLRNMTSKIKEANPDAFGELQKQLRELNVKGSDLLTRNENGRASEEGMVLESDFLRDAMDFYSEMVQIVDASGLLRFKAPSKDLKDYLSRLVGDKG